MKKVLSILAAAFVLGILAASLAFAAARDGTAVVIAAPAAQADPTEYLQSVVAKQPDGGGLMTMVAISTCHHEKGFAAIVAGRHDKGATPILAAISSGVITLSDFKLAGGERKIFSASNSPQQEKSAKTGGSHATATMVSCLQAQEWPTV